MKYKLFLDDCRIPANCASYMHTRIGQSNIIYTEIFVLYSGLCVSLFPNDGKHDWICVKDYKEFTDCIDKLGLPYLISFDHDLADEHYNVEAMDKKEDYDKLYEKFGEKTGLDCAKWLVDFCSYHGVPTPKYVVHSMNPIGKINIENALRK